MKPAWNLAMAVAIASGLALSAHAQAQSSKWLRFPPPPKEFDAAKRTAAVRMLEEGTVGDSETLNNYFKDYFYQMTNAAKAAEMHRIRRDRIKEDLRKAGAAAVQDAHNYVNNLLVNALPKFIARPEYNPAFRYNCALLLADLDAVEKQSGVPGEATPLPEALPKLVAILSDAKQHDAMRLAALNGVTRHAALNADAQVRGRIAADVLRFLDELEKESGATRKRDVKLWFEVRAMEALGATAVPTPETVVAIQSRLADENLPLWVRAAAADAFAHLEFSADNKVDAKAALDQFRSLVFTAIDQEASRRELMEVIYVANRGIVGPAERRDPSLAAKDHDAKSLIAVLSTTDKTLESQANQIVRAIKEMRDVCDDTRVRTDRELTDKIEEIATRLKSGAISGDEVAPEALTPDEATPDDDSRAVDTEADDIFNTDSGQ